MYVSKATQNILIKSLKLLFFTICLAYILNRVETEGFEFSFFVSSTDLVLFFLLMLINWSLESIKWRTLLVNVENVSFTTSIKSVLAGLSFGLLTPNRIGNFVGKILWLHPENRVKGTIFAFYGNFSQLVTTLFFGSIAFAFFHAEYFNIYNGAIVFLPLLFSLLFIALFLYPKMIANPFSKKIFSNEMLGNFSAVESFPSKVSVLSWSFLRHLVFSLQYMIVLSYSSSFNFVESFISVQLILLFTTMIPSLIFGKIIIRETVAVFILSQLGYTTSFIVSAILFVWLINIALPSLIGSFLFLIKKRN